MISKLHPPVCRIIWFCLDAKSLCLASRTSKAWDQNIEQFGQYIMTQFDAQYTHLLCAVVHDRKIRWKEAIFRFSPLWDFLKRIEALQNKALVPPKLPFMQSFTEQMPLNSSQKKSLTIVDRKDNLKNQFYSELPITLVVFNHQFMYVHANSTMGGIKHSKLTLLNSKAEVISAVPFDSKGDENFSMGSPYNFKIMVIFERLILCYSDNEIVIGNLLPQKKGNIQMRYIMDVFGKKPKAHTAVEFKKDLFKEIFKTIAEIT